MSQVVIIHLKPIPPDPNLEKLEKRSLNYRNRMNTRSCIYCSNEATQLLCYELEGCTKVEKYCDMHASKLEI